MIKSIVLQQDIFITTDGLSKTNTATFLWILSTTTGLRPLSNTELSNGHYCYSYRTVAMAIVLVLYFLRYYSLYNNKQNNTKRTMFTDSDAFLKGYKKFKYYADIGATLMIQFMCVEWELLNKIYSILQDLPFMVNLQFIKSHQDDDCKYDKLILPSQLNVDTDALAEDKRLQSDSSLLYAPMLSYMKLQVLIDDCTITKKVTAMIEHQYQSRVSLSYFVSRFNLNQ